MALVQEFELKPMERNAVHQAITATYSVFECDGRKFVQIDTYGRDDRKMPGRKSQSFQLDERGARSLFALLKDEFHF